MEIGSYYYPGWNSRNGKSEWDLVRSAKSYFEGHNQPRIPHRDIGYYDDENPETIRKQVKMAQEHGVDAFIFDWYWKRGQRELETPLQNFTALDAKMKFALMWSWKLPKRDLPIQPGIETEPERKRWVETTKEDFIDLLDHCNKNYFGKKNYWKKDKKNYFVMYFTQGFTRMLGRDALNEMLDFGREHLKKKGSEIYFAGVSTGVEETEGLHFDALTGYNFLPDFKINGKIKPIQDYEDLAKRRANDWRIIARESKLPYIPSIALGWDATPRGVPIESIGENIGFPWAPIITGNTPEKFGEFLQKGLDFADSNAQDRVHICSWNEWSEGNHLEPDTRNGYAYLEQVKRIKSRL